MLLRIQAGRGFALTDDVRERVTGCTNLARLESWGERAVTATSVTEIFGD